MRRTLIIALIAVSTAAFGQKKNPQTWIWDTANRTCWGNSFLPKDSGLERSKAFGGITFTGRSVSYTHADTWYFIYASDGKMYSCWTDGDINGVGGGNPNPRAARIEGDGPMCLEVFPVGKNIQHYGENGPGGRFSFGRYPCAQLMYNDVWYYGTYQLEEKDRTTYMPHLDWPILQPFIGFRVSGDFGENWNDKADPDNPLLENAHDKWVKSHNVEYNGYEVMIGAPHFVDFGENMKYAPVDEKTGRRWAYMVAHGADAGVDIAENSWIRGDNIYLIRILMPEGKDVEANSAYMNDASNWEYLSKDGSYRKWNRDNLSEVYDNIKPIVDATGYLGNVAMAYDAPLGKFIMTLSRCDQAESFNTLILESDRIDGDYRVVDYLKGFSTVSYFMNVPSRFISEDGKRMWLCFSANYWDRIATLAGSAYAMCLAEFELDGTKEASANKYEAEGMDKLGTAVSKVDSSASNLTVVGEISHVGDGLEFRSRSNGSRISMAVANGGKHQKQVSVYVNGKFRSKLTVEPSGDAGKYRASSASVSVKYGDRVTIRTDKDDVLFNRLCGGLNDDGTVNNDTSYHLIGQVDYITIEK